MRIDLILESRDPPERLAELARLAEDNGLGAVWVSSMLDARDPFLNFAEVARTTRRIRMGPIAVSPYELHPLKMATALLSLNEASGGRAHIVVGGGGGTMTAMGLQSTRRVRGVRECIDILKMAAKGQRFSYEGELFTVRNYNPDWAVSAPPVIYAGANRLQMQKMAPQVADGIMLSDKIVEQVSQARAIIDESLNSCGRDPAAFRLNNFWAWHVKDTREEAEAEARIWLALRGVLMKKNHGYFMNEDDMNLVEEKRPAFFDALRRRSPRIDGVPDRIVKLLVDNLTSCAAVNDLDREIDRLRQFQAAGLTEIALRIYANPEATIRLLGERVVPALA